MRLRPSEISAFDRVLSPRAEGRGAELYLFGSRADDRARGGDIDLLILAPPALAKELRDGKHFLLAELERELREERRIDLVVAELGKAKRDPFLRKALPGAILLRRWPKAARPRGPSAPAAQRAAVDKSAIARHNGGTERDRGPNERRKGPGAARRRASPKR